MSRIGKRTLTIPANTTVEVENNTVKINGKLGILTLNTSPLIKVVVENNQIKTVRQNEQKHTKQLHGTTNSLLNAMLIGVTEGFKKDIEIKGVGYRAVLQDNILTLNVGYSHPVTIEIPSDIKVKLAKPTEINIEGIDKQKVGQLAAIIRKVRVPNPYSGKGIMYKGEVIRRKEGKASSK